MDIDEVADELYGLEPADFVATRTARVKQARTAGDRTLAAKIAGLRRPTTVAWMVNILARARADDVENLLELGEAMRDAQRHLAKDELRVLTAQRQQVVRAMAKQAGALAAEYGYQAGEGALREVGQSLHAALADPEVGELVRSGRLLSAVSYSGMGPAGLVLVGGSEHKGKAPRAPREQVPDGAIREARKQLVDAEEDERLAEAAARAAHADAERATESLDDAAAKVEELRVQLTRAEQELQFARRAEQAATGLATTSDRDLQQARERVAHARTSLESLAKGSADPGP